MAKKTTSPSPSTAVTAERAARLFRLLMLLGRGPQTRAGITRRLRLGIRGFYRDLEALRLVEIIVDLEKGRYVLTGELKGIIDRLPFPDPGLNLGEARQLCKGRSRAHYKLRKLIQQIVKVG